MKIKFGEIRHFRSYPRNMQVLLITNMIYAFVLPVVELFVGTYIMRNSSELAYVVGYQLAVYTGIPLTFLINGFIMKKVKMSWLYSFGMLLSGVSMAVMMGLNELSLSGIVTAGLIMGASYGFFWANRDFLALGSTDNENRNYYYGLESFFNTFASVVVPFGIGAFIGASSNHGWFNSNLNTAYKMVTLFVFALTVLASCVICRGRFDNPDKTRFLFARYDRQWWEMMVMAGLKGIAQGYIVTAPSMLIMSLVGTERTLGILQSIGALISAILLYILGRLTKPGHRIWIFSSGLILFAIGGALNAWLYSAAGAIIFIMCLCFARPLLDMGYFPTQMRVIDYLSRKESRNSYAYIFIHEFGLYLGRFLGCGLFIVLAVYISDVFALRYALLIIGIIQMLSIWISQNINRNLDKFEK
ncbi:MAG: MFS transporter [Bacteroidales bacterium]|nr:MFS transporter [Bacteroidales bacterium]